MRMASWPDAERIPPTSDEARYADFVALLPLHSETMLRVAAALVGPADAEDAAQEAVVRAWQAWSSLRDPAAARAWLLRITVNVCRDWRRGHFGARLRLNTSLDDSSEESIVGAIASLGDDPGASDHASVLDLRRAIATLKGDLRLIVALRYYADMDATAIGAALDMPPATVRTRLKRALGVLRERLADPERHENNPHATPGSRSEFPYERHDLERGR
ncbi:MAG TPA: sigma-70 family RNA polymerase sigma factor [Ktedonobacterales bacterium]|nr:sigma-70 family RNA polymerase sigma factor [Ktedonobacterales bacterium]